MAFKTVLYLLTVFVYAHSRVVENLEGGPSDAASYDINGLSSNASSLPRKYIAGGADAELGKFPWMAYLTIQYIYQCGGSLISTRHVLTAAHCFRDLNFKHHHEIEIYLGEYNRASYPKDCAQDKCFFNKKVYPDKIIMHKHFNSAKNANNDIALLRLEKRIHLTPNIQLISLPTFDIDDPSNAVRITPSGEIPLLIAGWGIKTQGSGMVDILQAGVIKLKPKTQCQEEEYTRIASSIFCTEKITGTTCGGDSGGPALMYYRNKYYVTGITSHGYTCGSSLSYYTNVFRHMKWIKSHMED